jgi:hypothetical protein
MTEEVKKDAPATGTTEVKTEAPAKKEPSAIELKAMEMGWRPVEEWDGDPEEFVDAKEYVGRQPLFEKIQSQGKALKETNKALEALKNHYTRVQEAAVRKAIEELEAQRANAVNDGDGDTFKRLDKKIKDAEKEVDEIKRIQQAPLVQEQPAEHPAFAQWKKQNPWYTASAPMRAFATQLGYDLAAQGMSPEEVLKEVEKEVRKEFPHKFRNPNKDTAPNVENGRGKGAATKSLEDDMTDAERGIMNTLVRGGHITKEKYLADLKIVKERK